MTPVLLPFTRHFVIPGSCSHATLVGGTGNFSHAETGERWQGTISVVFFLKVVILKVSSFYAIVETVMVKAGKMEKGRANC